MLVAASVLTHSIWLSVTAVSSIGAGVAVSADLVHTDLITYHMINHDHTIMLIPYALHTLRILLLVVTVHIPFPDEPYRSTFQGPEDFWPAITNTKIRQ